MKLQYSKLLSTQTSNEVFYLDCSSLETGTHKDMRSKYIVDYAVRKGVGNLHLITMGNAGISLKRAIDKSGAKISLVNIVPSDLEEEIVRLLTGHNSLVVRSDLEKEFLSEEKMKGLANGNSYDATYVEGYQYDKMIEVAVNISPDHIVLPVGSGELYNCFSNYIRRNQLSTKLTGIVPKGNHPLSSKESDERTIADKLYSKFMNPKAINKINEALSEGHEIIEISNEQISYCLIISENLGLDLESYHTLQRRDVKKNNLFYLLNPVGCIEAINIKNIKKLIGLRLILKK